jgi:hypothetical protein
VEIGEFTERCVCPEEYQQRDCTHDETILHGCKLPKKMRTVSV